MNTPARQPDPIVAELTRLRQHYHLSQLAIGHRLGRSHNAICQYERGNRAPTLPMLRAWARIFGLDLALTDSVGPVS